MVESVGNEALPGVRVPRAVLAREALSADPAAFDAALERAWQLPKVELHLHLEGSLRPQSVCEMAPRYEPDSPFCSPGWWTTYWTFRDLSGFVTEFGRVLRACLQTPEDYFRVAAECFEDLAAQHVAYAEVSVGPRVPDRPYYVPLADTVAAIDEARREVEASTAGQLRAGIIIGLSRNHLIQHELGPEALALQYVRESLQARESGVAIAGIDLHGDEQAAPDVMPYVPAFRLASEAGLGLRAHAGEGTGPETVWPSLQHLRPQRIAHGVRSLEDSALVAHLVAAGIPLDVCPTSNVLTGAAASLRAHPIQALRAAGVPVTVSSDDPLVFDTSVTAEIAILHDALGFSWADLAEMQRTAARHSFLPEAERDALAAQIEAAWTPSTHA
jgi:adenosine deaminase